MTQTPKAPTVHQRHWQKVTQAQLEDIERLRDALRPFALFADKRNMTNPDMVITNGSQMAKKQLTMQDCYKAREILTLSEQR